MFFLPSLSGSAPQAVKPVFIKDRAASSIELIAAAHSGLPHWARPTHLTSPLG
jgi:hypothetical protein